MVGASPILSVSSQGFECERDPLATANAKRDDMLASTFCADSKWIRNDFIYHRVCQRPADRA